MEKLRNKIQLISYPDCLGGNLRGLKTVLTEYFDGAFGGVHILPFHPSSRRRGFSVLTHQEVDPKFGNWEDVQSVAGDFDLICDLSVNHISAKSKQFQDFLEKGQESEFADWFITGEKFSRHVRGKKRKSWGDFLPTVERFVNFLRRHDRVLHRQGVNVFALKKTTHAPRTGSPFVELSLGDGKKDEVWCTFSEDQIDLDVENEQVQKMFEQAMDKLAQNGTKMLRLGAIGYVCKKRGTENFMIPRTYEFIQWLAGVAHEKEMAILPQIHHHHTTQIKLANTEGVDYVYDFALPMLVLRAIYSGNAKYLKNWIRIRPHNQITTLDTHDGIGVIDIADLMPKGEIENTVEKLREYGGNAAMRSTGEDEQSTDIYQQNITFYSAVGANDRKYLLARAVQFFIPGIPQVYYVGLLAGENDEMKFGQTKSGKDLMRHDYTFEEIEIAYKKDVVQDLHKLMKFRNSHEAFGGEFSMKNTDDRKVVLRWEKGATFCELRADFGSSKAVIEYSDKETGGTEFFEVC